MVIVRKNPPGSNSSVLQPKQQFKVLARLNEEILKIIKPGLDFISKDLPSVLVLIIADQILNDLLCCSHKYN